MVTMQGPLRDVYQAALGLGTANQLTNILRDVGEDATERNRIYLPTQELKDFGIAESEVSCHYDGSSHHHYDIKHQSTENLSAGKSRYLYCQVSL